ncbi:hydrogenase iron-sulfur subunit [Desulfobacca acetoxidans]|uniref:Methyl-viologen-reducing hydrogenase delta subunit n=1 Tax=Desulfobacca acetoxidans (strain ATCC 700848 / DSM 11109 / ASRB2) TaxID=880072 RepID=F2NGS5_DESAR|nr:hydrogenase iron-sulfur subunit [Desulfobacca acetoxidans]AEB08696.1 methyl-viologen-reducing hydrogenase delta subunit [Desulfobacca acetoxidans DSM 11109]
MTPPTRIGLFLGRSAAQSTPRLDLARLKKAGESWNQVNVVQELEQIYSPEGLLRLREAMIDYNLEGAMLVADSQALGVKTLALQLTAAGLDPEVIESVSWRDLNLTDQNSELNNLQVETVLRQAIARFVHKDRLQFEDMSVCQKVLVLGHGWSALQAATQLRNLGLTVLLVTSRGELGDKRPASGYTEETARTLDQLLAEANHPAEIEVHLSSRIMEFEGTAGQYRVLVADNEGRSQTYQVGGVILVPEPELITDFAAWNPAPGRRAISLGDLEDWWPSRDKPAPFQTLTAAEPHPVIFLLGFTHHSSPLSQQRAYRAALRLAEGYGQRVLVLLDHYKVADEGLEALSQQARQAGIVFAKVNGGQPVIETTDDGALAVRFFDEVMNQDMAVRPELLILEEAIQPPGEARELAKVLDLQSDSYGFIQGDHIYNLPIYTNRTGILAVGPARGPISLAGSFQEVREAALHLWELLGSGSSRAALNRISLDRRKCAICLTCYRLCPHRAISVVNRRPVFSDLACKVCGLCAAECPMEALQIHNYNDRQIQAELSVLVSQPTIASDADYPLILAICCRNSALEAARLAIQRKLALPPGLGLIEVPCAGKVDPNYVMTGFKAGADGVMVLACHPESCRSYRGSPRAQERVALLQEYLQEVGLEPERLVYGGLASGMSQEFAHMARQLANRLQEFGQSPLRRANNREKSNFPHPNPLPEGKGI